MPASERTPKAGEGEPAPGEPAPASGAGELGAEEKAAKAEEEFQRKLEKKRNELIPDAVDHFLGRLLKGLETRNLQDLHILYEDEYNKLIDKFFKSSRWPCFEAVTHQISPNPLFLILYKELYYRHVFTKLTPTFDDRRNSWENYCMLLDLIVDDLGSEEELSVALPPQWVWDVLDEFIYHYQTFCFYRNKTVKLQREADVQRVKDAPDVWETQKVLSYLHQLIKTSRIEEYLQSPSDKPQGAAGGPWTDETTRLLGYFGLMQLLRMHSLLGDFHHAMKTIEKVDFDEEVPLFYKTPACHATLYYYMGFSYLMLRRYVDAIRTFSDILVFISKTFGLNHTSYQYDALMKKQEQMYVLLLICTALSPRSIDEALEKHIEKTYVDKQARLQSGDIVTFEELFSYACPKFLSAALPESAYSAGNDFNANEAHRRQVDLFLQEVRQQQFLPKIGSYMKLYTAIKTSKLAALCDMDEEGLRDQLMCVMHKTEQCVRSKAKPLDGERQYCGEVEFYLDGDTVHINAHKPEPAHAEVFLDQILKFQDLLKRMGKVPDPGAAAA